MKNAKEFLEEELPHIYNSDNIAQYEVVQAMERFAEYKTDVSLLSDDELKEECRRRGYTIEHFANGFDD